MDKLVVLSLEEGSLENGFSVKLRISSGGFHTTTEMIGYLPPNQEIVEHYTAWRSNYLRISRFRVGAPGGQLKNYSPESLKQSQEQR